MSSFKTALDLTTRAINRRAFHHRNLVVLVVAVVLISILWAIISWSAFPLLGLPLLLPLCGGFFFLDSLLVSRWNERLLELWSEGDLDLKSFTQAVGAMRIFPRGTIAGMLDMLPTANAIPSSPNTKRALLITARTTNRCAGDRIAARALAYTCGAAAAVLALEGLLWLALAVLLLAVPVLATGWWVRFARCGRWRSALLAMQDEEVMTLLGSAHQPAVTSGR